MEKCKYFGVRTSNREEKKPCQKCKATSLELFKKCTVETNIMMGTSTEVDEKGNTVTTPPTNVSDTALMFEDNFLTGSGCAAKKKKSQTGSGKEKEVVKRKVNKRQMCRTLLGEGKPDSAIIKAITVAYTTEKVDEKTANRRAGDILKQEKVKLEG